jgi:hypothetical protein
MSVSDEANKLRVELVRLGTRHGRRYPDGMKESVLKFIEHAREAGMTLSECCRRLGLSPKLLSSWRAALRAAEPKALVPVKIVDGTPWPTLSVVAPNGYRVEGLTAEQAIELMRALA